MPDAEAPDLAGTAGQVVAPTRPAKTFLDMWRSLGLMALVIAGLLLLGPARTLVFPDSASRMPVKDYSHHVAAFRNAVGAVLAPTTLPAGWRATVASITAPAGSTVSMHIGWGVPGEHFAGLDESSGPAQGLVRDVLGARGAAVQGTTQIAGEQWQRRTSSRGETAYTRQFGHVFVVVTGSATDAQLRALVTSLQLQTG